METEYIVFLSFVAFWLILFSYVTVVGPQHRLRRFTQQMHAWGWQSHTVEQIRAWPDFEDAVLGEGAGRERQYEFDRKVGFAREQVRRQETRCSVLRSPLFLLSGRYDRLAACVQVREVVRTHRRMFLPFWGPARKRTYTIDVLWLGEVRPFPIPQPILIYSWAGRFTGDHFRRLAAKRDVPSEFFPSLALTPQAIEESPDFQYLLKTHQKTLDAVRPDIIVAPTAWVMTAALASASKRMAAVQSLCDELSRMLEVLSRRRLGGDDDVKARFLGRIF